MSERAPCPACGSARVTQIRTSKRVVELPIDGVRIRFLRLSLERCRDCGHITMYGKTCLGSFNKTYIPVDEVLETAPALAGA